MSRTTGGEFLLAHLAGDYLLQTNHQANAKIAAWGPALQHAATYTAAHLPLTRDWRALAVIGGTHAVIDRYRLAKYVTWAKNQIGPRDSRTTLAELRESGTGYPAATPPWMAVWLMIVADNTIHLLINAAALRRWGASR